MKTFNDFYDFYRLPKKEMVKLLSSCFRRVSEKSVSVFYRVFKVDVEDYGFNELVFSLTRP